MSQGVFLCSPPPPAPTPGGPFAIWTYPAMPAGPIACGPRIMAIMLTPIACTAELST